MLAEAAIAKPGVMVYHYSDGRTVRELLPPETLYDAASLATLARKPVTLEHPPAGVNVDPSNVAALGVGDIDGLVEVPNADEQARGGYAYVKIAVRRKDALDAVKAGKQQVSPGYLCVVRDEKGVHPVFGAYDAVQVKRSYNHLAIVDMARGGPDVRLRADGAHGATPAPHPAAPAAPGAPMNPKLLALLIAAGVPKADAEAAEIPEAMADTLAAMLEQAAQDEAELEKLKAEKPKADAAQAKAEEDARIAYAAERAPLIEVAAGFKIDGADKLGNAALRKAIVIAADPKAPTDKDDTYYAARVDTYQALANAPANGWPTGTLPPPKAKTDAKDRSEPREDDGLDSYTRGLRNSRTPATATP